MSTKQPTPAVVNRLARLAALATALAALLAFRAEASAQEPMPGVAASVPIQVTVVEGKSPTQRVQFSDGWVMEITPRATRQVLVNGLSYQTVYDSVPYRRTEYLANPSYRHDTTVELLAGQLRPTVIQRTNNPERVVNPRPEMYRPYIPSYSDFWSQAGFRYLTPFMPLHPLPIAMGALPW